MGAWPSAACGCCLAAPSCLTQLPSNPNPTARQDADAHLQHHFDSIQEIADGTTIPSLLPALWRALAQAADVDAPLELLRRGQVGGAGSSSSGSKGGVSTSEKVALWEELKVAAFTRLLASVWLLPLLDLFVRVQLNILGRHLYLESALDTRWAVCVRACVLGLRLAGAW